MIKSLLFCLIFLIALSACGTHNDNFPNRLKPGAEIEEAIMSDASMRIDCDALRLSYEAGGVIFQRSTHGVISGVRLADGAAFDFDPGKPELLINGVAMELIEAKIIKHSANTEWHRCISQQGDKIYIVINDL